MSLPKKLLADFDEVLKKEDTNLVQKEFVMHFKIILLDING